MRKQYTNQAILRYARGCTTMQNVTGTPTTATDQSDPPKQADTNIISLLAKNYNNKEEKNTHNKKGTFL